MRKKYKVGFLVSHPIQYFSPLFRRLSQEDWCDLIVYYCSDETIRHFEDKGFGKVIKWDVPLLEGYNYKFLKNINKYGGVQKGFWGLVNPSLFSEIKKDDIDILIIHGWNYFSTFFAIVAGRYIGYRVFLRSENPFNQEIRKTKLKLFLKKLILGRFLFKYIDKFLYVGEENKKFYKFYGVNTKNLFFTPYCIDNSLFNKSKINEKRIIKLKKEFGIRKNNKVILFSGKLIEKKRPFDLLLAYDKLPIEIKRFTKLIYVGDGYFRKKLEDYVKGKNLNVIFVGFVNQTDLPNFYSLSDIFVLPSGMGETWGLVVNEAMNFGLPIITTNLVGCSTDLVKHGINGFIFETGNVEELSKYLNILLRSDDLRENMGKKSLEIIDKYNYENVIKGIKKAIESMEL